MAKKPKKSKDAIAAPTVLKTFNKQDKAMRHLGAFERDNRQLGQNLALQVKLASGGAEAG